MSRMSTGGGAELSPEQAILAWAQHYAFQLGWVLQPIHKCLGVDPNTGRLVCSCELTGKKWNNCNEEKPGKHPWKGWKQVPMETPEQGYNAFFDVWQQYPHGVNIGIRTGRVSGIWAIDLDIGPAKNGVIDLNHWLNTHNLDWEELDTLTAVTGGGGRHIVFDYPNNVEKIPTVAPHAEMGPAVDIKGDGGYILVAPSVHTSGRIYEWQTYPESRAVLKAAPDKVIAAVQKKKRSFGGVDLTYTPSLEELKDYADDLGRKKSQRAKDVGKNMLNALNGAAIVEDGGAHDAYRDIMYFIAKRWPQCDPKEILTHFQDSVAERFAHKVDASTDMSNLMDSLYTALEKANEEAQSWIGQVEVNDQGRPIASDSNFLLYFRNHPAWEGVFGYDQRRNRPVYLRRPPLTIDDKTNEIELARDKTELALWFKTKTFASGRISKDDIQSAMLRAAWDKPFDPLYNKVMELRGTWDGTRRLATALQRSAGAPDTEWVRIIFPIWIRSLVARIIWPGCKADSMLILEGKQGFKKSTFFSTLLPDEDYFSDSLSKVGHSIETIRMVHSGPAIFEIGELSGLKKQEVEEIKAFLSAKADDLRPLYEPPRKAKRRCIFVGTTNRNDYLRDETGGRRFWPVKVNKKIDIQLVTFERAQWFAEAIADIERGSIWWLDDDHTTDLAQAEQDARFEEDIWQETTERWLANKAEVIENPSSATEQMSAEMNKQRAGDIVTTTQVALYALKIEMKNAKTTEGFRINKILRKLGWTPVRFEDDDKKWKRGWKRPGSDPKTPWTPN